MYVYNVSNMNRYVIIKITHKRLSNSERLLYTYYGFLF